MKKIILLTFFACSMLGFKGRSQAVNTQDSLALVDLYHATKNPWGADWFHSTNWLSNRPLSSWYGVVVKDARVTELHLGDNWLRGTLPSSLGNLDQLTFLELSSDDWLAENSGHLPSTFSRLTRLTYLNLSGFSFDDNIPDYIGNLVNLTTLNLASCFGNASSGQVFPSFISNLSHLTYLNLSSNFLRGSIASFANLTQITTLNLSNNQLTNSALFQFDKLINLTSLDLSHNKFDIIPEQIGNCTQLKELKLLDNPLTGSIPASIGNLINLTELDLSNHKLTGNIPSSLGNLTQLKKLNFSNNLLSGNIPTSLGNLINLSEFYISGNQLSGDIPDSFAKLVNLSSIDLSKNQITGNISMLSNLTRLSLLYMDLSYNQLSGPIPAFFLNNRHIFYNITGSILLSHNNFSGSIPLFQGNEDAIIIDLSYNQLTDTIPSLVFPHGLKIFNVSHNHLTSPLPSFPAAAIYNSINFSYNEFSGPIPQYLFRGSPFVEMYLNNNRFTGNILNLFPVTRWTLQILDISNNQLTDTIPASIKRVPILSQFKCQNNRFTGSVTILTKITDHDNNYRLTQAWLWGNHFTFTGIEDLVHKAADVRFNYQTLPIITKGLQLSISVGGILSHNRYDWYRDSTLLLSKTGDSILNVTLPGKYSVVVTDMEALANGENVKIISDTVLAKIAGVTITCTPDSNSCTYAKKTVTFKAETIYAGTAPTFQWTVNGVKVKKTTQPLYTTTDLKNNDTVRCILTSNADSVLYNVVTSNYIKMAITTIARYRDTLFGCNMLVYKGVTYRGSTEVYDTLRNTRGCDSVYTITTIKIRKVKAVAKDTAIAACNKVVYKGITYKTSTVLRDTLRDTYGCDSIYNTATITVLTKPAPLSAITGPTSVLRGQIGIQYSVTPVSGITYYWLVKNATITAGQGTNKITVTWGNASGGVSAYAINTCDTSNVSHIVVSANSSFAGNSVALQASGEQKIAGVVKLYPNPTANTANLQLQGARGRVTVEITDLMGKKLWQQDKITASTLALPVENLPAGIYMVTVKDNTGQVTLKLEKIK